MTAGSRLNRHSPQAARQSNGLLTASIHAVSRWKKARDVPAVRPVLVPKFLAEKLLFCRNQSGIQRQEGERAGRQKASVANEPDITWEVLQLCR
jgi:hypothetical protein